MVIILIMAIASNATITGITHMEAIQATCINMGK